MKHDSIRYYSTSLSSDEVVFSKALMKGLAPDGGLYMPTFLPVLHRSEILRFSSQSYSEIATSVLFPLLKDEVSESELHRLALGAYNFPVPVEDAGDQLHILRLDQGPTASFKDFAARMMARLMQYFNRHADRNLVILVATSGDTGSAIASAFHRLEGVEVVILFPDAEVSENQRRQMTTMGDNVKVLSVDGKFDDCQRMVKQAFLDRELAGISLTSANSINIGRLLPQSVYYFYAWSRLSDASGDVRFAVPSGNFGNVTGGLLAMKMGLPVRGFIVATNSNDEFPLYLESGSYEPIIPSRNAISNAMNVGHPSNLSRIISLYGGMMDAQGQIISMPDMKSLRRDFFSFSVSDGLTLETMARYYNNRKIITEPHGATALAAVEEYRRINCGTDTSDSIVISIETAHPAKFPELVSMVTGTAPDIPVSLTGLGDKSEVFQRIEGKYEILKEYLLEMYFV